MNDYALSVALLRGHALHARIARDTKELKGIADAICAHALDRPKEHVPLEDEKSEGTRWIYARDGRAVVVVCPKDKLKGSVGSKSKDGIALEKTCGAQLSLLFDKVPSYVPKAKIRDLVAAADLSAAAKAKVIRLITGDSSPQVKWEIQP